MTECGATLEVDMIPSHSEEEGEEETDSGEVWGRLFPVGKGFVAQGVCEYISDPSYSSTSSTYQSLCTFAHVHCRTSER